MKELLFATDELDQADALLELVRVCAIEVENTFHANAMGQGVPGSRREARQGAGILERARAMLPNEVPPASKEFDGSTPEQ